MLERFTPETQTLVMRAHALAQAGRSNSVELVHMWVTALESDARFQDLVRNSGASLPEFFLALPAEETAQVVSDVPLSANVKWMLETALREMVTIRQHQVTPWAVYMALAKHSERLPASITVDSERIISHLRQPYFSRNIINDGHIELPFDGIHSSYANSDAQPLESMPDTAEQTYNIQENSGNDTATPVSVPPLNYDFSAPVDESRTEHNTPTGEVPPMPPIPPAFSAHDASVAAAPVEPVPPVAPVPPPPATPQPHQIVPPPVQPYGVPPMPHHVPQPQPIQHPPLAPLGYPPLQHIPPYPVPPVLSSTPPVFPPVSSAPNELPQDYTPMPSSNHTIPWHVPTDGVVVTERDGRQTIYVDGSEQFSATDGSVTALFDTLGIRYAHVRFVH